MHVVFNLYGKEKEHFSISVFSQTYTTVGIRETTTGAITFCLPRYTIVGIVGRSGVGTHT